MKIRRYEGGIPYEVEIPDPPAATMRAFAAFMDAHCSCRGSEHDECADNEDDE